MGFHLRKSINLGGVRVNLSSSGVGFSTGVKGLRVGIDGKGRNYIGGGKGILRYRKIFSNKKMKNNTVEEINKEIIPASLKIYISMKAKKILFIFFSPLWLLMLIFSIYSLFQGIGGFIFGSIFFLLPTIWIPYSMFFSKDIKMKNSANIAIKEYNNQNYEEAIIKFKEADEQRPKSANWELMYYFPEMIFKCYKKKKDYEGAIEYIKYSIINGRREKTVECLYILKNWNGLIEYIQKEYSSEERNEHPIILSMLGEAFLNSDKKEIALETMLSGPVRKRNMDIEICAFRYVLGKCYESNNDKVNALKQYQKVYTFDVSYEDVAERIEKLSN